jgi:hypothetical protein
MAPNQNFRQRGCQLQASGSASVPDLANGFGSKLSNFTTMRWGRDIPIPTLAKIKIEKCVL